VTVSLTICKFFDLSLRGAVEHQRLKNGSKGRTRSSATRVKRENTEFSLGTQQYKSLLASNSNQKVAGNFAGSREWLFYDASGFGFPNFVPRAFATAIPAFVRSVAVLAIRFFLRMSVFGANNFVFFDSQPACAAVRNTSRIQSETFFCERLAARSISSFSPFGRRHINRTSLATPSGNVGLPRFTFFGIVAKIVSVRQ
jgi:hypothetical protein